MASNSISMPVSIINHTVNGDDLQDEIDKKTTENARFTDSSDSDRHLIKQFITKWFAGVTEGHILVEAIPHDRNDNNLFFNCMKARKSFSLDMDGNKLVAGISRSIDLWSKKLDFMKINWYIGVAPRTVELHRETMEDGSKSWVGGTKEYVATLQGVWADIDMHTEKDAVNYAHALKMLDLLKEKYYIQPMLVVSSGGRGGKHIYFKFPQEVSKFDGERIGKKLAVVLKSDSSVAEAARMMRLPGTWHTKTGVPKLVEITHATDELVHPERLEQMLDQLITQYGVDAPPIPTYDRSPHINDSPWKDVPVDIADKLSRETCMRLDYYLSDVGTQEIRYPSWLHLATWAHALTSDPELFEIWGTPYSLLHKNGTPIQKWDDTIDMLPISCHRAQDDFPLRECRTCPFYSDNKNPALLVRKTLGKGKLWGAPITPTKHFSSKQFRKSRHSMSMQNQGGNH